MSSIGSIILVIVMAFSSVFGATANLEGTTSFDAKIGLDMQTVMAMSGGSADEETNKAVEEILDAITIKGVADKESAELDLFAGEDLMLSLGVKKQETGVRFASTLLKDMAIDCSDELIAQMQQQMMGSMVQGNSGVDLQSMMDQMQKMDWEQIGKDFSEAVEKVSLLIQEKTGEPEEGEFTVDGMNFTVKVPVNVTYVELTETLLLAAKEFVSKESVKPLLETLAKGQDIPAEIDKALENLKNQPAEQQYDLAIATYKDAEGSYYVSIDASRPASEDGTVKAEALHIGIGQIGNQSKVLVTSLDETRFELTAGATENGSFELLVSLVGQGIAADANVVTGADGSFDATVNANIQNMPIRIHAATAKAEERVNFQAEVYLMNMEKAMLTVNGSAGKGGEPVAVYEGETMAVIQAEKLMDDTDTSLSAQMQSKLMAGIMQGLSVLMKNVPKETSQWLATSMQQMMTPSTDITKTPEEAPAGNQ